MRIYQKPCILRYKTRGNAVLWAFMDDFRHNAFLLKNHKMRMRWNHQLCAEIWPKTLKYHVKIEVIGFLYFLYENLVCNLQKTFDNSRFFLRQSSGEIPQSTLWFQQNTKNVKMSNWCLNTQHNTSYWWVAGCVELFPKRHWKRILENCWDYIFWETCYIRLSQTNISVQFWQHTW